MTDVCSRALLWLSRMLKSTWHTHIETFRHKPIKYKVMSSIVSGIGEAPSTLTNNTENLLKP